MSRIWIKFTPSLSIYMWIWQGHESISTHSRLYGHAQGFSNPQLIHLLIAQCHDKRGLELGQILILVKINFTLRNRFVSVRIDFVWLNYLWLKMTDWHIAINRSLRCPYKSSTWDRCWIFLWILSIEFSSHFTFRLSSGTCH